MGRREIIRLFRQHCRQKIHPFPARRAKLCAPNGLGVYVIRDAANRVVHVGRIPRAKGGIHQRLCDHLSGRSSFAYYYLNGDSSQLREAYSFQYLEVPDSRERAILEAFATGWLCPAHLGLGAANSDEADVDSTPDSGSNQPIPG